MRAGRLRHRLTLQSKTETRDSYGAALITWTTQATVWGSIEPLSGREYLAQQQINAEANVRIVIRWRGDIDETWRVKHTNYGTSPGTVTYYDVEDAINHDLRNQQMTLMCRQGVSEL